MNLQPGEEIGEEVHETVDQFFRFESGQGKMVINGVEHNVAGGDGVLVPAGSRHNVINISVSASLKLYTIYSPPNHKDATVHRIKADETEEHFDGTTTE
jgi:mannose-6-phosphate isomerase-like protein (cupin superfamily)